MHKTSRSDEAEKVYLEATEIQPDNIQAWQGLSKIYEESVAAKLPAFRLAVLRLAEIYRDTNDARRCAEVVNAFIAHVRTLDLEKDNRRDIVDAYGLLLPDCPLYPTLEGQIPHPAATYELVAKIIEDDEKDRFNTLLGKLSGRIGTTKAGNTLQAKQEVWAGSKRADVYRQLINWTGDDEIRRSYEEKLLQYCYDRLLISRKDERAEILKVVRKLAADMVIIKHPFRLAWDITINWQDFKEIGEWDITVLREYCMLFPYTDLYKVLVSFLSSDLSPFPKLDDEQLNTPPGAEGKQQSGEAGEDSDDDEDGGAPTAMVPLTEDDRLTMIMEGVAGGDSLLAYRMAAEYYQSIEDHESNAELMKDALAYAAAESKRFGLGLLNTEDVFTLYLATALVYYQSPRNHQEAKKLFDRVLEHDPTSTPGLIGVGLIYEEEQEYDEAIDFLERAFARDKENLRVRTEAAWVHSLKGEYARARGGARSLHPAHREAGPVGKTAAGPDPLPPGILSVERRHVQGLAERPHQGVCAVHQRAEERHELRTRIHELGRVLRRLRQGQEASNAVFPEGRGALAIGGRVGREACSHLCRGLRLGPGGARRPAGRRLWQGEAAARLETEGDQLAVCCYGRGPAQQARVPEGHCLVPGRNADLSA